MEKKEILEQLFALKEKLPLSEEEMVTIDQAIIIIKKAKTWKQCTGAVELLIRLMGIGSNFF
ncbi:MAG: hypothetical protein ACJ748_01955 [Flavisolibacter sp.]